MADQNNPGGGGAATGQGSAGFDALGNAGAAMREGSQKLAENSSALSLKLLDQAEANTREAFTAMRSAAGAKDLTEVMKIQGDYLRDQGQRSMTQAREIGELIMQFGRGSVSGFGTR